MKYSILKLILPVSIFLTFSISAFTQDYWFQQPSPTQKRLTKSLFIDSLYGWVIGDSGIVINTTNGGSNWSVQQSGIYSSELKDISFISRTTGWIIALDSTYKSFILNTTNGGESWSKTYFPDTTAFMNTLYFIDNLTGYVSGFRGDIYKTTNAGSTWNICYIDTTGCLYLFPKEDILFIDSQTGYAAGGVLDLQGIFVKTTNAGASWFSYCVAAEPLRKIIYRGNNRIALMGGDYDLGSIYAVSSNGGNNWSYEMTGCWGNATGFAFRTPAEVWAALNFSGSFAVNLDSMKPGSRWTCINTPGNVEVNSIEFLSETKGYAFGDLGSIFKFNEKIIGINEGTINLPLQTKLYQNFPNPFNPTTSIRYEIPKNAHVSIKVFDILGKELFSFNEYKLAGSYEVKFDGSYLASGIYFYVLKAEISHLPSQKQGQDVYTEAKKMVLLK